MCVYVFLNACPDVRLSWFQSRPIEKQSGFNNQVSLDDVVNEATH